MRYLAIIAALAASPALAVDIPQPRPQANAGAVAGASSTAAAWSASNAVSGAVAGAQGGSATAEGGQGGSSSIVFNSPANPASVDYRFSGGVKNVPDVYAPALAGGNPCTLSASLGGAVLGFGISGGIGYESDNCNRRAEAALLWNMDERVAAVLHLRLHIPEVGETFKAIEGGE